MNDPTLDPEPTDREYLDQCDEGYRRDMDLLLEPVECKETWRSIKLLRRYYVPLLQPKRTKLEYVRDSLMLKLNYYTILIELTDPNVVGERDNITSALMSDIRETHCEATELVLGSMKDEQPNERQMAMLIAAEIDDKVERTHRVNFPLTPILPLIGPRSYAYDKSEGSGPDSVDFEDMPPTGVDATITWLEALEDVPAPTVTGTTRTAPEDIHSLPSRATRRIRAEQGAYLDKVSQIRTRFTICSAMFRMARIDLTARYDFKELKLECVFWLMYAALSSLERLNGMSFTNPEALMERERHVKDLQSTFMHEFNTILERLGRVVGTKDHKERTLARLVAADVDECTKRARDYGVECELLTPFVVASEVDIE